MSLYLRISGKNILNCNLWLLVVVLFSVIQVVYSENGGWTKTLMTQKGFIGGGVFFLNADTDLRLEGDTTRGTTIDLEDLLEFQVVFVVYMVSNLLLGEFHIHR